MVKHEFTQPDFSKDNWQKIYEENFKELKEQDEEAKDKNTLVGRFISEPFADGKATYVITKENKKSVRIHVATGFGDDWTIPYWGAETAINKNYALQKIRSQEALTALFNG